MNIFNIICFLLLGSTVLQTQYAYSNNTQMVTKPLVASANPIINKNVPLLGKNGLYGLADRAGKIIVQPQYDYAPGFNSNGIAVASRNKKKGLINNEGKDLTPFEYDSDLGFADGAFLFRKKKPLLNNRLNEVTYLLDETGKLVLTDADKPYKIESHLYQNRALVKTTEGYGYADRKGKLVIPAIYMPPSLMGTSSHWFQDGVATVRKRNDRWILIDVNGKTITANDYYSIGGGHVLFSRKVWEGVFTYKTAEGKWGYLNKEGKEITPAVYDGVSLFREGMGKVWTKNGFPYKQGFVDKTGKEVIPLIYDVVNDFSEGLAAVQIQRKWGFIDKTGQTVIQPQFEFAGNFSEGLALASKNGKQGFINKKGEWVIAPQYGQTSGKFVEGLAGINVNGKWGFIDKTGKVVIEPKYVKYGLSDFEDGIKLFELGDYTLNNVQFIFIDKLGRAFIEQ